MSPAALSVAGLTVVRGNDAALRDVAVDVPAGTSLAVIGPNGSGKTTLLHAIAGLLPVAGGRIEVDRHDLALVLQSTEVDRSLPITVAETVAMGRYPHVGLFRRFGHGERRAVADALERMDLGGLAGGQLHDLSGGQRQRVMVAQGLAQEAGLLLLDEPVTGLDVISRDLIFHAIDAELARGRTIAMTTHDLVDAHRCDLVLLLARRVVAFGPPRAVITEEHLRAAFGERIARLGDGSWFVDDPHHHHAAHPHGRG